MDNRLGFKLEKRIDFTLNVNIIENSEYECRRISFYEDLNCKFCQRIIQNIQKYTCFMNARYSFYRFEIFTFLESLKNSRDTAPQQISHQGSRKNL
ncbi:unnamed protein product [Paramecium octaurelia]|uniref:Uncharacterized protein n=1 Tax=Paramecium octaurelia TaxID=43137 RepID=A0A8S1X4P0_PAROT|nr:unnamed protein product [Paramecium octaurelia]